MRFERAAENRILGFDNRVGLPILIPALLFFFRGAA